MTRMTTEELRRPGVKDEFMDLMKYCNFVSSIDDEKLPTGRNVTYCFPKRYQCNELEEVILKRIILLYNPSSRKANDYEETRTQIMPGSASAYATKN